MAGHPLRPAKDLWLGELLPHQQPNPTQAHLTAINLLAVKDSPFGLLSRTVRQIPTRYSPVRLVAPEGAALPGPVGTGQTATTDLHVLSISLAFILSQDQTLCFAFAAAPKGPQLPVATTNSSSFAAAQGPQHIKILCGCDNISDQFHQIPRLVFQ